MVVVVMNDDDGSGGDDCNGDGDDDSADGGGDGNGDDGCDDGMMMLSADVLVVSGHVTLHCLPSADCRQHSGRTGHTTDQY